MNYHNKIFAPISNSDNGIINKDTRFHYKQEGNILTCTYSGDNIITGHLIGVVDTEGNIDMRYHQINREGQLMTGSCQSVPKIEDGLLFLHETWQWTSGDLSQGRSILQEVKQEKIKKNKGIDKRQRLISRPFTYAFTKDEKLIVYRDNKQVKIIGKKASKHFSQWLDNLPNENNIQLKLAKLTGHYKHGNER